MSRAAELFRALGEPTRLAVLERVARREMTVSELTARFGISQPAISQHLAVLRREGLVSSRRSGRLVYYRVDPAGLRPIRHWLARLGRPRSTSGAGR